MNEVLSYQSTGHPCGNEILRCDAFLISYNESPGMGMSFFAGDSGSDETAICVGGDYFILNGDFREQYAALSKSGGLGACLRFYLDNLPLKSSWSDSPDKARTLLADAA